ncbi:P8 family protein [Lactiplantibacillus mudanjiangensis]|uniref:Uncharacterized protein n=1 Tax=Lactiplantibacillus mudanjiangensis TaxID=1296538 RepID=A0A660E9U2_9LACO|nr:hypothetical protein [Lactiplantibacillus mudanjiangensis]VDG21158.1 hypothetical protein MUDAN_BIHEEGNE_02790 [Lactiplantibacillus mudanjiangensis]VDG22905.1 hypothetical protein MUDAN_IGPPGNFN_00442 [Lactiplantibacillus mudanjiangensis]VDG29235.1 hypothetical protein MUDAN_MDHGFNIF_00916 [Lactiplantibacillus mudanjiangensis]VDG31761.1 hypothetical protein MUDAN_DOGOELCO_01051 [Lactiplantibacillus mudanjiangensis]
MATAVEMNSMLDEKMTDVFDWSDSKLPVRDAIWNHFMDADSHDTDKTADEVAPYMSMDQAKLKSEVEKLLKA